MKRCFWVLPAPIEPLRNSIFRPTAVAIPKTQIHPLPSASALACVCWRPGPLRMSTRPTLVARDASSRGTNSPTSCNAWAKNTVASCTRQSWVSWLKTPCTAERVAKYVPPYHPSRIKSWIWSPSCNTRACFLHSACFHLPSTASNSSLRAASQENQTNFTPAGSTTWSLASLGPIRTCSSVRRES